MKERPILFSGEMIKAILAGRKTQTRRLQGLDEINIEPGRWRVWGPEIEGNWAFTDHPLQGEKGTTPHVKCPYGTAGDRLWIKESWRTVEALDQCSPVEMAERCLDAGYSKPWAPIQYTADGVRDNWEHYSGYEVGRNRASIHMPRWASRSTLEVVSVRVERVQDISEDDARAEGVAPAEGGIGWYPKHPYYSSFRDLWDSINGKRGYDWNTNPWVWAIEFKKV